MKIHAIGVAWYREEDYEKLKSIFTDSHLLPGRYDQWLDQAENLVKHEVAQGRIVEKVYIDPATFPDWCKSRQMNINSEARIQFANEFVARKYRPGG